MHLGGWGEGQLVVADFNGDGKQDIVGLKPGNSFGLFLSGPNGFGENAQFWNPSATQGENFNPVSLAAGVFDEINPLPGLAILHQGSPNSISIYSNTKTSSVDLYCPVSTYNNGFFTDTTALTWDPSLDPSLLPISIVSADFNQDQHLDLAVLSADRVSFFQGNGDGTFAQQPDLLFNADILSNYSAVALAEGRFGSGAVPGLVVAFSSNDGSSPGIVQIYPGALNNFPSTPDSVPHRVGVGPTSILVYDFNQDGYPDVAVTSNNHGEDGMVTIWLGNGSQGFNETPTVISIPGVQDVLLANSVGSHAVLYAPIGGFSSCGSQAGNGSCGQVIAYQMGGVQGDGTLAYSILSQFNTSYSGIGGLALGDFDGDGLKSMAVSRWGGNDVAIFKGDNQGHFYSSEFAAGNSPTMTALADFNGDGLNDIAMIDQGSNTLSIYDLSGSQGSNFLLTSPSATTVVSTGNCPTALVTGAFHGGSNLDVAVSNTCDNTVGIFLGNGDGTFAWTNYPGPQMVTYPAGSSPGRLVAADLNGDGKLDLAVVNMDDGTVTVMLGNGDGTFGNFSTYPVGNGPSAIAAADFDGDDLPDLVVSNQWDGTVSVLLSSQGYNTNNTVTINDNQAGQVNPVALVVGDWDGDLNADIAVVSSSEAYFLYGDGTGRFLIQNQAPYAENGNNAGGVVDIHTADLNGDGIPDFVFGNGAVFTLMGTGVKSNGDPTQPPTSPPVWVSSSEGGNTYSFSLGDVNGDGVADIVTPSTEGFLTIGYGFTPLTTAR